MPEHPKSTKRGYIAEHRLVAEKKVGRYLYDNEVVHHINENKHDNSPKNVEVMTSAEHSSLHAKKRKRDESGKLKI